MAKRLLVVLVVVGIAVVVVSSGSATAPGKNGQIVYAKFPRLWVINSDGTGERMLPHPKGSEDTNPDWSPDGSKLAFERCSKWCEVWTVNEDGTAPRRLGPNCLHASGACKDRGGPAWSPDGTRIAFGQASVVRRRDTVRGDLRDERQRNRATPGHTTSRPGNRSPPTCSTRHGHPTGSNSSSRYATPRKATRRTGVRSSSSTPTAQTSANSRSGASTPEIPRTGLPTAG